MDMDIAHSPMAQSQSVNFSLAQVTANQATQYEDTNFNPPISRKLMEGLFGLSSNTLVRYEQMGLLHPVKVLYGGLEMVTYSIEDVHTLMKKRNFSFKSRDKAEVIAGFNNKGGTGKTGVICSLAALLSLVGKTLLIDVDPQGDCSSIIGVKNSNELVDRKAEAEPSIIELLDWTTAEGESLYRRLPFDKVVKRISPGLDLIQGDLDLGEVNYSLNRHQFRDKVGSDGEVRPQVLYMVKEFIDSISNQYDYILFDMPPNVETFNVNCLFASNRIISVLEIESKCLRTIDRVEDFLLRLKGLHPGFSWEKILVVANKFKREVLKNMALAKLQEYYSNGEFLQLSRAVIPLSSIIDKCTAAKEPMFYTASKYGKGNKANVPLAQDFTNLYWAIAHELFDKPLERLIFSKENDEHLMET